MTYYDDFSEFVAQMWDEISDRNKAVLIRRISSTPEKLQAIANDISITRQRVDQIERKYRTRFRLMNDTLPKVTLYNEAPAVMSPEEFDNQLEFVVNKFVPDSQSCLAKIVLMQSTDYVRLNGFWMRNEVKEIAKNLKAPVVRAQRQGDPLLMIDLQKRVPNSYNWSNSWEDLLQAAGLRRVFDSVISHNLQGSIIAAYAQHKGKPFNSDEAAEVLGITRHNARASLQRFPHIERIAFDTWDLKSRGREHFTNVVDKMLDFIERNGPTELPVIANDISKRFNVRSQTVRQYANQTPRFKMIDGVVHITPDDELQALIDETDVELEYPVIFSIYANELLTRGFSQLIPEHVAVSAGCKLGGHTAYEITSPEGCEPITFFWQLDAIAGPTVGHLMAPFAKLGGKVGDRIRITLNEDQTATVEIAESS